VEVEVLPAQEADEADVGASLQEALQHSTQAESESNNATLTQSTEVCFSPVILTAVAGLE
jgi:hypothetical protein